MDKVILTVGLLVITIIGMVMAATSLVAYVYMLGVISSM